MGSTERMSETKGVFGNLKFSKDAPCLTLCSNSGSPDIAVETLHISCRSDKFDKNKNFIGFVMYSYKGKTTWELNNVRCRTGYIYFKEAVKLDGIQGDTMHARAFFNLFGVDLDKNDVVASGFAFKDGVWKENSTTFNHNDTPYTDQLCRDGVTEMDGVKNAILSWTSGGCQNFQTSRLGSGHGGKKFGRLQHQG